MIAICYNPLIVYKEYDYGTGSFPTPDLKPKEENIYWYENKRMPSINYNNGNIKDKPFVKKLINKHFKSKRK
jgi:hypothetical protein